MGRWRNDKEKIAVLNSDEETLPMEKLMLATSVGPCYLPQLSVRLNQYT